nr:MAG TPA: hypothetical protein [Caudoviricetes sp.]
MFSDIRIYPKNTETRYSFLKRPLLKMHKLKWHQQRLIIYGVL